MPSSLENEIVESITEPIDVNTSFKLTLKTQESSRRLAVASKFRAPGLVHPGMGSGSRVSVVSLSSLGSVAGSRGESVVCCSAPSSPRQPDRSKITTISDERALFFMLVRSISCLNLFSLHPTCRLGVAQFTQMQKPSFPFSSYSGAFCTRGISAT